MIFNMNTEGFPCNSESSQKSLVKEIQRIIQYLRSFLLRYNIWQYKVPYVPRALFKHTQYEMCKLPENLSENIQFTFKLCRVDHGIVCWCQNSRKSTFMASACDSITSKVRQRCVLHRKLSAVRRYDAALRNKSYDQNYL